MIPKIAVFFGVSLDELFGIEDMEKAEDLVTRFSCLRDEYSYNEARSFLETEIKNDENNENEVQRYKILKLHLLLQNARKSVQEALEISGDLLNNADLGDGVKLAVKLQKYQLMIMNGDIKKVYDECRQTMISKPDIDSVFIFLEILFMLQDYKQMINSVESDGLINNMIHPPSEKNISIWTQYIKALVFEEEKDKIESTLNQVSSFMSREQYFEVLMLVIRIYSKPDEQAIRERMKEKMLNLLSKIEYNENIKRKLQDQIKAY